MRSSWAVPLSFLTACLAPERNVDLGAPDTGDTGVVTPSVPDGMCAPQSHTGTTGSARIPRPVVYYTFDESHRSQGFALNAVDDAYDARLLGSIGPTGLEGQVLNALGFEGDDARTVSFPPKTSVFTIAFWVWPNAWSSQEPANLVNLGDGPESKGGVVVKLTADGHIEAATNEAGGSTSVRSRTCINSKAWTHIVLTRDRSALRLMINGRTDEARPVTAPDVVYGDAGLVLASSAGPDTPHFLGALDEFALWDQTLALADVEEAYLIGTEGRSLVCSTRCAERPAVSANIPTDGLVGWFRADLGVHLGQQREVCAWCDLSGTDHHLTQVQPTLQPIWLEEGPHGHAVVRFAPQRTVVREDDLDIPNEAGRTIAVLFRPHTLSARAVPFSMGSVNSSATFIQVETNTFRSTEGRMGVFVNQGFEAGPIPGTEDELIYVLRLNSMVAEATALDEIRLRLNGIDQGATPTEVGTSTIGPFVANRTGIGGFNGSGWGGFDVAEVLVYNRALPIVDLERLEAHLSAAR